MIHTRRIVTACLCGALAVPTAARAHITLLRSSPSAAANLTVAPGEVRLTFSERPEPVLTGITLIGPNGSPVVLDSLVIDGNVAVAGIRGPLIAGIYRVEWRTVSRDGHPVQGAYDFSIAHDAAGLAPPPEADTAVATEVGIPAPAVADAPPVFAPLTIFLRWFTLAGVIAAIGAVSFRATVLSRVEREMDPDIALDYLPRASRATATLGLSAVLIVGVVAIGRLLLQSVAMDPGSAAGVSVGRMLLETNWGRAWLLHIVMVIVASLGFGFARRLRHPAWTVAGLASIGLTLSLALSGHAMVVPGLVPVTVIAHVVHTVAAAGWLGTLLSIAVVGLPLALRLRREERWTIVADIVNTFSPAALVFAGATVVAGVFLAWTHLGTLPALWNSEYGQVLIIKLSLLGMTAAIGAYNWRRVRPGLGEAGGTRRLRRSSAVELAFAGLLIAVTAVLVGTPMPLQ